MIAIHFALLPMSCVAMYVPTVFALYANARNNCGRHHTFIAVRDLSLVTAQIATGAIVMDSPMLSFAGDGYIRAWFSMALAMAAAGAGRWSILKIDTVLKGERDANV